MNFSKVIGITLLIFSSPLWAEGSESGAELYSANCTRCHGSETYAPGDRSVDSWDNLIKQVNNCNIMLEMSWFDEDIKAVSTHLNSEYYHFAQPAD